MRPGVTHVIVGPSRHGVVLHAERLAAARGADADVLRAVDAESVGGLAGRHVIMHVTDRLFGASAAEATNAVRALLAEAGRSVVVLHDLPQASDGDHRDARMRAYAEIAAAADRVVVASEHEATLLRLCGASSEPTVLPLPVSPSPRATRPSPGEVPCIVVVGFIYPGKGHDVLIKACARLDSRVRLVNAGGVSQGHEALAQTLAEQAGAAGVEWTCTGWLPDDDLAAWLHRADVGVAPHQHISASGSINAWIEAGRRPLVARSSYAEELLAMTGDGITIVDGTPEAFAEAIGTALADPDTTWRTGPTGQPTPGECAQVLERLAAQ